MKLSDDERNKKDEKEKKYKALVGKIIDRIKHPEKLNLWRNEARMFDPNIGYNIFIDYDSADSSILKDIQFQRMLSEELAANHPAYCALINSLVTHTTLDGFGFTMDVPGHEALNELTKKHFKRWSKCVSADWVGSFNEVADMICHNYFLYGEAFGLIVNEDDDEYGIRYRGVPTVRIENPTSMNDEGYFKGGIEQNRLGKPKAIYIRKDQTGDAGYWKKPYFDQDGNRLVLHTYSKKFFDQSHGSVGSSPIYKMLNDLSLFMANEVRASSNASAINLISRRQNAAAVLGGLPTMQMGNLIDPNVPVAVPVQSIDPGIELNMRPDDTIEQFKLERPIPEYQNFLDANLRIICQAFGYSYEYIFCRWSDSNNSSAKIAALHTQKALKKVQTRVVETALEPLVRTWLRTIVNKGIIDLGDVDLDDYLHSFKIIRPQFPLLDEQKSIAAMAAAVDARLISLSEATERLGFGDAFVNIAQIGKEMRAMGAAGITPPNPPPPDEPTGENMIPGKVGKPASDGSTRSLSAGETIKKIKVIKKDKDSNK